MTDIPFLEVKDLTVRYESRERSINALDGVSLTLSTDDRIAIVGESGAGKTTLARCLVGLTKPTSGKILFKGKEILKGRHGDRTAFRKSVQVIFQDPYDAMNPKQNVFDYISMPLRFLVGGANREEQRLKCISLLESVGLQEDLLMKYPHQLSGGQKQRVAIGRALASDPEFLIADEPTSMLDASAAAGVLNLLKRLSDERGMGFAIVTHNMGVASYASNAIYVMYSGKVVEQRTTEGLVASARHPYSNVLLSHAPMSLAVTAKGEGRKPESTPAGYDEVDPWSLSGCRYRGLCDRKLPECEATFPELKIDGEDGKVACYNPFSAKR